MKSNFNQKEQGVFIQSKNGIQIKGYLKFNDWILEVMKKCISVVENISGNKPELHLDKYKEIYSYDYVSTKTGMGQWT